LATSTVSIASRLAARNTRSFTSLGAASASIQIFSCALSHAVLRRRPAHPGATSPAVEGKQRMPALQEAGIRIVAGASSVAWGGAVKNVVVAESTK